MSFTCGITFLANMISACPRSLTNFFAKFSLKNSGIVGIPFLMAFKAIFSAGSIPNILHPFSMKRLKNVPSLLAISTTYGAVFFLCKSLPKAFSANSQL